MCKPGATTCDFDLDADILGSDRLLGSIHFIRAADPPIDCFYVYPTASREKQDYSDLYADEAIAKTVKEQAGRLTSLCRLYVPLYRQATLEHLHVHPGPDWDGPYQDIVAAWSYYLAHDNHGRGVVIIGHSQGSILLQRLIAEQIDGQSSQARLVSAFLIGNPGLLVIPGQVLGGTFKRIPVCTASDQVGCVYSWASYAAGDDRPRVFGRNRDGLTVVCTNPAGPGEGVPLKGYFSRTQLAVPGRQPFVEISAQIAADCQSDDQGSVLRVRILPGRYADALRTRFDAARHRGEGQDWGLHRLDVALSQGSVMQRIAGQSRTWLQYHPG